MDKDKIKTRFDRAKAERQLVEAEIDEAYRWIHGTSIINPDARPDRSHIFDTTAETAVGDLVTTTMTHLLPQDKRWVTFQTNSRFRAEFGSSSEMDLMLGQFEEQFYEHVNGSEFYLASAESKFDAFISGTGAIGVTAASDEGLYYQALPIYQIYYLSSGCDIDVVFRLHKLPARTIVERYQRAPDWVRDLSRDKPDEQIEIIESMVPAKKRGHFEYQVWTKKDWTEISATTCPYKPFIVYRVDKSNGATCWSGSPVRTALADIRSVNQIMKDLLEDAEFIARPTYLVADNGVAMPDSYKSGQFILVDQSTMDSIKPLPRSGDLNVHVGQIQSLRDSINRALMQDVLPQGDRMTTAEVQVRTEKFFRRIGVHAIRLEEEFLQPLVRSTVAALQKSGLILNRIVLDGDPAYPKVDPRQTIIMSTRSLLQRVEAQAEVDRVLGTVFAASRLGQEGLMHVNLNKVGRYIFEKSNFPVSLMRSQEEVDQMIKAAQATQAISGIMQTRSGQGSPETSKATGEAIAGVLGQLDK